MPNSCLPFGVRSCQIPPMCIRWIIFGNKDQEILCSLWEWCIQGGNLQILHFTTARLLSFLELEVRTWLPTPTWLTRSQKLRYLQILPVFIAFFPTMMALLYLSSSSWPFMWEGNWSQTQALDQVVVDLWFIGRAAQIPFLSEFQCSYFLSLWLPCGSRGDWWIRIASGMVWCPEAELCLDLTSASYHLQLLGLI